jgi:mannose-1-phosphate guanylyltransferase/mannose-6-phosphate isomerase
MVVAPSDHFIADDEQFRRAVHAAVISAQAGNIATFGVRPDYPETGYGYIELEPGKAGSGGTTIPAERFVEKPPLREAEQMIASGRHLWNAGVFLFKTDTIACGHARVRARRSSGSRKRPC